MKIIYADMSMEMATEFLKNCYDIKVDIPLSLRFGFTALENSIKHIELHWCDKVILTNCPQAIDLLKNEMVDFETFLNSFYILRRDGSFALARKLTDKVLRAGNSFQRLLMAGAFF